MFLEKEKINVKTLASSVKNNLYEVNLKDCITKSNPNKNDQLKYIYIFINDKQKPSNSKTENCQSIFHS